VPNPDYMRGHNQKKDTHTLDFDLTLIKEVVGVEDLCEDPIL